MGSRFLRHAHRGSLAGNGRTRGRRFSAKVDFGDLISDESQKNNCTTVSSGRWGLRSDFGDRLVVEVVLGVTLAEKWRKVSAHFFRQSRTLDLMWKWPENGLKMAESNRKRAEIFLALFASFTIFYYWMEWSITKNDNRINVCKGLYEGKCVILISTLITIFTAIHSYSFRALPLHSTFLSHINLKVCIYIIW